MAESKSHRLRAFFGSPVALMRVSSILFFLTMFGHAAAYPWTSTTRDLRETMLVE